MEWTSQSAPFSEQSSMQNDLPYQTVALINLDLARWRPAESYDTSPYNETPEESHVNTSIEDSGIASPTTYTTNMDSGSSSEDDENCGPDPDTLEYARLHGLCKDYMMDYPLASDVIPPVPEDLYHDMEDPSGEAELHAFQAEVYASLNERLNVDKETAAFLCSIIAEGKRFEEGPIPVELETARRKWPKLDLPVLATDHDVEMLALRRRSEARLSSKGLEPFQLDPEKDDGMVFPQAEIERKRLLDHELSREKFDISKETMEFLLELREFSKDDQVNYADDSYASYKNAKAIRLSPPLLPVTPPYSPKDPAPEAMQIDMTSTPEDLIAKDAAVAEQQLLDNDRVVSATPVGTPKFDAQDTAAVIDSYTAVPSSSSPLARKRLRNLRVEPPLTPQYHAASSSEGESNTKKAKRVQFDPDLVTLFPDAQQTESSDTLPEHAKQQANDLLVTMTVAAKSIQQQLQQEQLIEVDTTLRVKVPPLERVQAQPPWDLYAGCETPKTGLLSQQSMLKHVSKELLNDTRKWSGVTKIERSLPWAPFPTHLAKVDLEKQFDDGSLARCLAQMDFDDAGGDVDVQAIIARDDHLRLLQADDSDDEEIEANEDGEYDCADAASEEEHQSLAEAVDVPPTTKPDLLSLLRQKQADLNKAKTHDLRPSVPRGEEGILSTSATAGRLVQNDGIASFMQLHGKAQGLQRYTAQAARMSGPLAVRPASNPAPAAVMVQHAETPKLKAKPDIAVPVPQVISPESTTIPVVVSSGFMANRQMVRRLQTILPSIDFCERDATAGSTKELYEDADITISPSTGVLVTTLQKLKQRPLPGQSSLIGIRHHIASVARRHEHLDVLVSEGATVTTGESVVIRPLDQSDCEALTDTSIWAQSLDSDVQIIYVPGGDTEISIWLASSISHLGVVNDSLRLLQDETMWERWLRRAGMNAFSAQAVLSQLKLPDAEPSIASTSSMAAESPASRRFGLAAFVLMDVEERVERFGSLLGGERLVRRTSENIDKGLGVR